MPVTLVVPGLFTINAEQDDNATPPATFTLDFTCDINSYDLQQAPVNITVPASFCADGYDDVSSVTQSLVLSVLCNWEDPASFAWFLSDNHLKKGWVQVVPTAGTMPAWVANVRFVRPNITLATGSAAVVTVTLPVFSMTPTKPTVLVTLAAEPHTVDQTEPQPEAQPEAQGEPAPV